MPKEPKPEPTKGTRHAYLFARLSGWFFLGSLLSSTYAWQTPWPWIPTAFFILSVLSLFIICPTFLIKGNPKRSTEHQLGINGLILGIIALAILGFCIAQCTA